ncbi:MAG: YncE family protein [Pelobacteraceae bacterium]
MILINKKTLRSLLLLITLTILLPSVLFATEPVYIVNNNGSVSVIETGSDTAAATIPLPPDSKPTALCLNPITSHAYTLNGGNNTISIIDTAARSVINTISDPKFTALTTLACDPTGTTVLVGNNDSNGLTSRILYLSTSSHALSDLDTVVGKNPGSIVFDKIGSKAYVLNQGAPSISVINTSTKQVTSTTALLDTDSPYALAIHTQDAYLYVVNLTGNSVTFINPATMEIYPTPLAVSSFPNAIAVSSTSNTLYVAEFDAVSQVDPVTKNRTATFSTPSPEALIVRNDGNRLYIASFLDDIIRAYSTSSLTATPVLISLPSGSSPRSLATLSGTRHNLALTITGNGTGSVNWPFKAVYPQSTSETVGVPESISVTTNATADTCSSVDWIGCDLVSGGGTQSANCTTPPLTANKTINAVFTKNIHSIITSVSGGIGTINCPTQTCGTGSAICYITSGTGYTLTSLTDNGRNILGDVTGSVTGDMFLQIQNIVEDHSILAEFNNGSFVVTPSAGVNGSISPSAPQTVSYGNTVSFTVTPDSANGYKIASVTGCGGTLNGNTYTTGPITSACSLSAAFTLNQYQVSTSAGTGGSVAPATVQNIGHGSSASFTITPDTAGGYSIINVSGCGGTLNGTTYTTGPITANCSISAIFETNSYTITATIPGGNGSVSCTPNVAYYGASASCTFVPANGYQLSSLADNGSDILVTANTTSYSINNITSNHALAATFSLKNHTVTASAGINGTVAPSTPQIVTDGNTTSFSVAPESGYHVVTPANSLCGGTLYGTVFTTGSISADCSIAFEFAPNLYTVNATASSGGSITPATSSAPYGRSATFTVVPASGYSIGRVTGCGGSLSGTVYTTGTINGDCSISATFIATPTVTPSVAGGNGMITCSTSFFSGDNVQCLITPDNGYHLSSLTDNGINVLSSLMNKNSYSLAAVTSSHIINASFAPYELADALRALRIAVGIESPSPDEYVWLDIAPLDTEKPQGDGVIDIMDALVLLKHTIGTYPAW